MFGSPHVSGGLVRFSRNRGTTRERSSTLNALRLKNTHRRTPPDVLAGIVAHWLRQTKGEIRTVVTLPCLSTLTPVRYDL